MLGNRTDAEDAVAEAYARAWDRWSTVRECDSPEAWVRTVAYRIAVSAWRRTVNRLRAHHRQTVDQHLDGISVDHVALVAALRRIPADQRRVVVLHHLVGLSVTEIATEIGSNPNTVKTWLVRGRRDLAAHLRVGGREEYGAAEPRGRDRKATPHQRAGGRRNDGT
ncbi:RNA polymerase sigma factor [Micromonospora sp. WMMA1923]